MGIEDSDFEEEKEELDPDEGPLEALLAQHPAIRNAIDPPPTDGPVINFLGDGNSKFMDLIHELGQDCPPGAVEEWKRKQRERYKQELKDQEQN